MKQLNFFKYQGTGNDFVMIDNRSDEFPKNNTELIRFLCDRRFGIGGDGLILLENDHATDFKMVYFNADGNESTMCGNGGRCIVAFAKDLGVIEKQAVFNAVDGLHTAYFKENGNVALQMIDISKNTIKIFQNDTFLFTGSPHHVMVVNDVENFDVYNKGKEIRYSDAYLPSGTNVNFVEQQTADTFKIRTYERGVENETLSCGTGATAVAIAMYTISKTVAKAINIEVQGGSLQITFNENADTFFNVMLTGSAKCVFKGEISV